MDNYEHETNAGLIERHSEALLIIVMALIFIAYFAMRAAMPDLPPFVYQVLASLPS